MQLSELKPGLALIGLEPDRICTVKAVIPLGDTAVQVYYQRPDGDVKERLITSADSDTIAVADPQHLWSFDGDGAAFQLACEAKRIDLAFLFDPMMAVHTSNIEPLPHQITAVYESMLPRQPLRYVLADDPGAGKTIMAGKYATYSKWIQREIQIAKGYSRSKPIVAIRPWENEQVSSIVKDNADRLVSWSTRSIASAIQELDP